jgi:hypothetical protein
MTTLFFSTCNPQQIEVIPAPLTTQQPPAISTEISEESILATEQARASTVQAAGALTRAAQPTFPPPPTLTPTSEYLATLTPISNSTPAEVGAFFNASPDVLGTKYAIENACYFDTQSGWERYEVYTGSLAGSGDEYTSQGVAIVRKFQAVEQGGKTNVELVDSNEYLTSHTAGPLRLDAWGNCGDDWIYLRTPLNFGWILDPVNGAFFLDKYSVPVARLEIDGRVQLGNLGSYCWNRSCADGGAIGTSPVPLITHSPLTAHLILPIQESPDGVRLDAMLVSPPGSLQSHPTYDYLGEDHASWAYNVPGREQIDIGELSLKSEQDINLSLKPGYYVWTILAIWHEFGDVKYGFLIEVQE